MRTIFVILVGCSLMTARIAWGQKGGGVLKPEELKALSFEEMLSRGEKAITEMKDLVKEILDALADAQKSKDFQRINCISDVMTTVKGLMRLSEQNILTLRERVIARDRSGAEHEFVKLMIAQSKIQDMHTNAKGCGGPAGETVFEGTPVVEKLFDEDLPKEDPTAGLGVPIFDLSPPPSASPYF